MSLDRKAWADAGVSLPSKLPRTRKSTPAATGKKRGSPERDVQRSILAWIKVVRPDSMAFAIENERAAHSQDRGQAARFQQCRKRSGVVAGMPDLGIVLPDQRIVWIEVKSATGSVRDSQKEVHARLRAMGHAVGVCRSVDDARDFFRKAGIETRENTGGLVPVCSVLDDVVQKALGF